MDMVTLGAVAEGEDADEMSQEMMILMGVF